MNKRFFKNWVFFIFLITWEIFFEWWELDLQLLPSSSSLLISLAESNHLLLAYILRMNESHDHGRPFKVAITTSAFSASSSTASRCYAFWIFTFFNYFLKSFFWITFLSSNILMKESNIFGVFREDTCSTSWSVIESTMIFLALIKFFLCKALRLISL